MFETLTTKINEAFKKITGKAKLSESNVNDAMREVRKALIDADVSLEVIKKFIAKVKSHALGKDVEKGLTPEQFFIKIVQNELTEIMGAECQELNLKAKAPVIIMMVGLQGSGKTTTTGKLAKYLKEKLHKKVCVVSCDIHRPAAIEQLQTVAQAVAVDFFPSTTNQKPQDIFNAALQHAKVAQHEVLIVDTAGRLQVDEAMMDEVALLHKVAQPSETLFVVDSMTGQEAANVAKSFNERISLTGVILTKVDGDARGGAALSIKYITDKPIKFMGEGEKLDALIPFHPERVASRILGMGDMLSLIEKIESTVDKEQSDKLAKKLLAGKGFNFNDLKMQLSQVQQLGGIGSLMEHIPGVAAHSQAIKNKLSGGEQHITTMLVMIDSMTKSERLNPHLIVGSRKTRIANGSGRKLSDVNRLLKQFENMQKMYKKMGGKGKMANMMKMLQQGQTDFGPM
jgi:signal recognition particle subunit SRP54